MFICAMLLFTAKFFVSLRGANELLEAGAWSGSLATDSSHRVARCSRAPLSFASFVMGLAWRWEVANAVVKKCFGFSSCFAFCMLCFSTSALQFCMLFCFLEMLFCFSQIPVRTFELQWRKFLHARVNWQLCIIHLLCVRSFFGSQICFVFLLLLLSCVRFLFCMCSWCHISKLMNSYKQLRTVPKSTTTTFQNILNHYWLFVQYIFSEFWALFVTVPNCF